MSFITKLFVVLVTIMAVALVAMLVPFVANSQNYRLQMEQAQAAKRAADAVATQRSAELTALEAQESQRIAKLTAEKEMLVSDISDLQQEVATAKARQQSESTRAAKQEAEVSRLTATGEYQAQMMRAFQEELRDRRQEMLEQQTRGIQLADRNNELSSQLETLNRQIRRMQEQMTGLEERNVDLEQTLARLPEDVRNQLDSTEGAVTEGYMPSSPIRGQIVDVQELQGQVFVQLNVGEKDGVAPNMKFWVHRGEEFLGTLVITAVDAQSAAGRVQLTQGQVAQGDEVLTGGM